MLTAAYSQPKGLPLYTKKPTSFFTGCTTYYCAPWQSVCLAVPILLVSAAIVVRTVSLLVAMRECHCVVHASCLPHIDVAFRRYVQDKVIRSCSSYLSAQPSYTQPSASKGNNQQQH